MSLERILKKRACHTPATWAANHHAMTTKPFLPLTIALVSEAGTRALDDAAQITRHLLPALLAQGCLLQTIGLPEPGQSPEARPRVSDLRLPGIRLPGFPYRVFAWPARNTLLRFWQKSAPDLVLVLTQGPLALAAVQAAHTLGVPALACPDVRLGRTGAARSAKLLDRLQRHYERYFHRRCQATLVPSVAWAQHFLARGIESVVMWPPGVDRHLFHPKQRCAGLRETWGAADNTFVVLFAGPLSAASNLQLVERAFAQIQSLRPDSRMVWLGEGPEFAELAAALPGHHFAGSPDTIGVARHFASADLLLCPSLSGGYGLTTLQGLASGLPVIAYRQGAAAQFIQTMVNGLTAPIGDEAAFLRLVEYAAVYRTVLGEMGARAARTPLPDWSDCAENWMTLARRILACEPLPMIPLQQQDEGENDALPHYTAIDRLGSGINPEM